MWYNSIFSFSCYLLFSILGTIPMWCHTSALILHAYVRWVSASTPLDHPFFIPLQTERLHQASVFSRKAVNTRLSMLFPAELKKCRFFLMWILFAVIKSQCAVDWGGEGGEGGGGREGGRGCVFTNAADWLFVDGGVDLEAAWQCMHATQERERQRRGEGGGGRRREGLRAALGLYTSPPVGEGSVFDSLWVGVLSCFISFN